VLVTLTCEGSAALAAEILPKGQPAALSLACGGGERTVEVSSGQAYVVHLRAADSAGGLQYIRYTLNIESLP
jgi:hypothetical protein